MIESQDQKRMKVAFAMVEDVKARFEDNKKKWDEYNSRVQSAPVFIHDASLMQVLAFYLSKKKENHVQLLAYHLMSWLLYGVQWDADRQRLDNLKDINWKLYGQLSQKNMIEHIVNTRNIQSFLKWLKRFSEAQLKEEPS